MTANTGKQHKDLEILYPDSSLLICQRFILLFCCSASPYDPAVELAG